MEARIGQKQSLILSDLDKEMEGFDSAISSFTSSSKSFSSKSSYSSFTNSDGVTAESEENHEANREVNMLKRSGEETQVSGYENESHNKASWDSRTGVTQSECTSSNNKISNVDQLSINDNAYGLASKLNQLKFSESLEDKSQKTNSSRSNSSNTVSESLQENGSNFQSRGMGKALTKNDSNASVQSQSSSTQSQTIVEESCIDTEQRNFKDVKSVFMNQQNNNASTRSVTKSGNDKKNTSAFSNELLKLESQQKRFEDNKKAYSELPATNRQTSPPSQYRPVIDTVDLLPRQIEDEIIMLENVQPFTPSDIEILFNPISRKITLEAHREEKTKDGGAILHSVSRYWVVPNSMELDQLNCFIDKKGQLVLSTKTILSEISRIKILNDDAQRQPTIDESEIIQEAVRPSDVRKKFEKIAAEEKANSQKQYIKINQSTSPILKTRSQKPDAPTNVSSATSPAPETPKTHLSTATVFVSAAEDKSQKDAKVEQATAEKQALKHTLKEAKQSVATAQDLLSERFDRKALEQEMKLQKDIIQDNAQYQVQTGKSTYDFMAECESEFRKIQQNAERAMQNNFGTFTDSFDTDMKMASLDSRHHMSSIFDDNASSRALKSRYALEHGHFGSLFHDIDADTRVQKLEQTGETLKFTVNVGSCREDQLRVKLISSRLVLEAEWEEGYSRRSIRREWTLPSSISPERIRCTLSSDGVLVITCGN
ncbi:uncharacterized protein LOC136035024 [Artemia franciscana]|uniref:SHSP domain-containing protein n=1 Tax=Artemia franciscana TaxID=6661 RepID=A0AA88LEX2_ARTSF|nr:hypothetical protein QYM36_002639 [Artemia franciscana]KAK2722157.1 hypothetical protein QYM36_002639 [Artemia franciscana]